MGSGGEREVTSLGVGGEGREERLWLPGRCVGKLRHAQWGSRREPVERAKPHHPAVTHRDVTPRGRRGDDQLCDNLSSPSFTRSRLLLMCDCYSQASPPHTLHPGMLSFFSFFPSLTF